MFVVNYMSSAPKLTENKKGGVSPEDYMYVKSDGKAVREKLEELGGVHPVRRNKGNRLVYEEEEEEGPVQVSSLSLTSVFIRRES